MTSPRCVSGATTSPRRRERAAFLVASAAKKLVGRGRERPQEHAFSFLDETGTLGGQRDPFFAVGLLRCREPYALQRPIQRLRDQHQFYDEIKWSSVSEKKLELLKIIIDVFLDSEATFSAFIAEKAKSDVIGRFGGPFQAYEALARQLVHGTIRGRETLWVVADEYSSPPGTSFEENVRDRVNERARWGNPVAGVCRMRSVGVDLLQLNDLLLGATVYEHKTQELAARFKPKVQLLEYFKQRAGVPTFVGGFRNERLNIAEYRP